MKAVEEARDWATTQCDTLRRVLEKKMTNSKYMRPGLDFARGKTIEELGELQSALGKSIRWGWRSENPELPQHQRETNLVWTLREIQDVRDAIDNLEREIKKEFP